MKIPTKLSQKHLFLAICIVMMALPIGRIPIYFLSFLLLFFTYASIAECLNIMIGYMGYYDFGRGLYFGIGAYTAAILLRDYGISPFLTIPLSALISFVIAFSVLVGARNMRGFYYALLTSTLVYFIFYLFLIIPWTGGPLGIVLAPLALDPYVAEVVFYESLFITLIVTVIITYLISRSKLGLGIKAIRGDELTSEMVGINTTYIKALTYGISAALTGVVGNLYGYYIGYVHPSTAFSWIFSLNTMLMVIIGGMGTIEGPIIGTFVYTLLSEALRYGIGATFEGLHMIIFGSLLIVTVLRLPQGIAGLSVIRELIRPSAKHARARM